ncbi:unnamed protein product [Victoria cruziana]
MAMPWTSSTEAHGGRCLKHPDRRPSPGVCSLCLKERLAHLSSCKPSSSSSASLSPNSHHSSLSTSSSFLDCSSSSPSSPAHPPCFAGAAAQPRTQMSYLISKEGRFTERSGRLWPLRRSSSAALEVKRSSVEKKQKKAAGGNDGGGNGLWSLLLLKRRKEVAGEEKAGGRSWRLAHPKTVKDILPLGVL